MTQQIERRTIPCEFRVSKESGKPVIFGYAAKFGVRSEDLGGWVEVLAPDCFEASLATNPDVRGLFNHDPSAILGRTVSGTMRLKTDKVGLAYEIDPPDTQVARDLMVSMERGDISQSSFGFICKDAAWGFDEVNGLDIRTVKAADLMDCSPVTYPAYTDATSGVRSLPADMPLEVRTKLGIPKPEKREDSADKCVCDCAQCAGGDCGICSNNDCTDETCSCQADRSLRHNSQVLAQRVKVQLALLS
jgi:uncharacterized protein